MASPLLQPTSNPAEKLKLEKATAPPGLITPPPPKTEEAKGLQRIVLRAQTFVISAQVATVKLLYGRYELQSEENVSKFRKAFDRGLLYILSKIASIDFCKIISTTLNGIQINKLVFDPFNPPPSTASSQEKNLWLVQYRAYQVQKAIDDFYSVFGSDSGPEMRRGLNKLVAKLNSTLGELTNQDNGISNPDLLKRFPEASIGLNYINNAIGVFSKYTNVREIQDGDVQNIINFIDGVKTATKVIIGLSNPADALGAADRLITGGQLDDAIKQAEEFFGSRGEPIKFIKYLLEKANSLNSTAKSILGYINLSRTIMKLLLLLTKAFYIIYLWFKGVPLSAAFTTVGALNSQNDTIDSVIKRRGIAAFIARLDQFDVLMRELAALAEIIVIGSVEIINKLNLVKMNMESCNPDIAKQIDDVINESKETSAKLNDFLNQINSNIERTDTSFGAYSIFIITEELADEGITLRRRYGIARDSNNYIVAQSTPTFASWDQIIINEVKFILASRGLVKTSISFLSPDQAVIYENALSLMGDDVVEFNAEELSALNFGEANTGDIAQFFSNLPGGAAFRKQSRDKVIANNQKLLDTLKQNDPNSKYTNSIVVQKQNENNKLRIEKLEEEKARLKAQITAAAAIPLTAAAVIPKLVKRIQQIDDEITALKTG